MSRLLRFELHKSTPHVDRALTCLVRNALRHVHGYRTILDEAHQADASVRGVEDLGRLPIVLKETLFRRFDLRDTLRRGTDPKRCVRTGTSGSTGLPLTVFMSRSEAHFRRALLLGAWRRAAPLRFPLTVADLGSLEWKDDAATVRRRGPVKIVRISIMLPVQEQIKCLMEHRPQILTGYPTSLQILSEALSATSNRTSFLHLVATRGEILHEETRRILHSALGSRVADFYNCEEIGNIAWECPADPSMLHVNTDGCVVEVVGEDGQRVPVGCEGRVIVTNLYNWTMPFIRYDLHDRGVIHHPGGERCECGSRSPRLLVLQGRDDDYLYLPDGRKVSPRLVATTVNRAIFGHPSLGEGDRLVRRFQVVQDASDHLTVRIIPESSQQIDFHSLISPALLRLHPDLRCTIDIVEDLPLDPSGKFRKVACELRELGAKP
ncbi:phenylacetate--CoA ligase family protein [Candidatus Bipolaricaulota bacterium]